MQRSSKVMFGILAVFGVVFIVAGLGLVALLTYEGSPDIAPGSLLVLELSGKYRDAAPDEDSTLAFLGTDHDTVYDIRSALRKAKVDARVRGAILKIGALNVGWGVAQEIRECLLDFRASGKQVTAFMESGSNKEYYVAVAADKIYLAPEGTLFLNGLTMEAQFFKDTLAKVGIEADMHTIGKYKGAPEAYTRSSLSDAQREVLNSMIDEFYSQLVTAVAQGRNLSEEAVRSAIDDFTFSPARAVEAKLLDGLLYYDQVLDGLKRPDEETPALVDLDEYERVDPQSLHLETGTQIAVLNISGEIRSGKSGRFGLFGREVVGSGTIVEALKEIRRDKDTKAVVVRISSPGGSSLASDIMWREISLLSKEKPVVVSMSDVAASGGYWVATAADTIVAQPGTITGSIGVFMGKFNVSELMDKVGVNVEVVSRGQYAQLLSPLRGFSEEELEKVTAMLQETYDTFVDRVAKSRKMSPHEVDQVARGRVWTGVQAKELGLVDELGGFDAAIDLAKEHAHIEASEDVRLVHYPEGDTLLAQVLETLGFSTEKALGPELSRVMSLASSQDVRSQAPGPWAMLPFIPLVY